ncbi:hypothetical protein AKJ09_01225 [Labilithrix luteola]|uniref:Uncharacterized protein n=1 Tax=Labilithrix luteola TaxID=1391654 RepID=A0A0K1PMD1_9BACT|nr:hypothetical protein AKJ09_01225 [Labilithrix luteola]
MASVHEPERVAPVSTRFPLVTQHERSGNPPLVGHLFSDRVRVCCLTN